jgi:hypothetical protein
MACRDQRRRRMRTRSIFLVTATVVAIGVTVANADAVTPVDVLATSAFESNPAATADYFAWDEYRPGSDHSISYVRTWGGDPVKVNADKTNGWAGGIDGTTLVYTQERYDRRRADVYTYDLIANTRSRLGRPVSTKKQSEGVGSLSGDWLLFERWYRNGDKRVFLYNLATHELRKIRSTSRQTTWLLSEQVNSDFAVFSRFIDRHHKPCDVFVYDIAAGTTTKVPNPKAKCQYAPSVDTTGTVYFARSGFGCAKNVVLRRFPVGGPPVTVMPLGDNLDLSQTYAVDNGDGTTDVYFDPANCDSFVPDIQKVTMPQ